MLDLCFKTFFPTRPNKHGNDTGIQYRTGIYTNRTLFFHSGEGYHHESLDKNPGGYCHIVPSLFEMAKRANQKMTDRKKGKRTLRSELTKGPYEVTQKENAHWDESREGIYA